jgi:hypothetical protein
MEKVYCLSLFVRQSTQAKFFWLRRSPSDGTLDFTGNPSDRRKSQRFTKIARFVGIRERA